ncbi:MAG: DnaJ domain-containing protein [Chloroflexota bacterium]
MANPRDAYKVLQIDPSALPEVVEAAYRALARLRHPDRNDLTDASQAMTELNWAYATLRDPERRIEYDETRTAAVSVSAPEGSLRDRMEAARGGGSQGLNPEGRVVLDFGRYSGMSLLEVARLDPEYLEWLKRRPHGARYRQQIEELTARLHAR